MILIILYAFRSELNYFYHRTLAVLIPFYTWVDNDDKQTIAIARQNDGHFYINTVVNNVPIRFMIDTGATGIALTKQDAIKLGINLKTLEYNKAHSTANGITYSAKVTLKSLRIENTVFSDIKAHVSQGNLDVSLLGMSVISRFKSFTIDQDLLYITPDL
ncbi:MAG: TIGR02281 family clan AA aspartic protease [Rickettsiaceae bacterium]